MPVAGVTQGADLTGAFARTAAGVRGFHRQDRSLVVGGVRGGDGRGGRAGEREGQEQAGQEGAGETAEGEAHGASFRSGPGIDKTLTA